LLAEKFRAAGGRMPNLMHFGIQFFELRCRDVAKRCDFIAWKQI
jgi:hypothetical protein